MRRIAVLSIVDGILETILELISCAEQIRRHQRHHREILSEIILQWSSCQEDFSASFDILDDLRHLRFAFLQRMSLIHNDDRWSRIPLRERERESSIIIVNIIIISIIVNSLNSQKNSLHFFKLNESILGRVIVALRLGELSCRCRFLCPASVSQPRRTVRRLGVTRRIPPERNHLLRREILRLFSFSVCRLNTFNKRGERSEFTSFVTKTFEFNELTVSFSLMELLRPIHWLISYRHAFITLRGQTMRTVLKWSFSRTCVIIVCSKQITWNVLPRPAQRHIRRRTKST